ncbi:uncharacterized protein [Montipora capricornis]|uniref:uncharacterized protein isoform X1 n=1 Tax=Montipora capricornis TaxID=246305 RepID=UPI0035F1FE26
MAAKKIDVSFNENYAILRMKSGENRLNPEFLREFNCALDEIESHKDVAFMITTGEGKYFSLGLDLDFMRKATMGEAEKVFTGFPALHLRLLTLPFPTIAALNGHAFGGGALLALAHDYRIMRTERGWFSINEIRLGLHMGKANALLTREKIKDPKTLSDAVLTGKRFSAQEAFSGGIVQTICPVEVLLVTAVQMGKTALGQHKLDRRVFTELRSNLYSDLVAAYKGHVPDYDNYSEFISQIKSTSKL